MTNPTPQVLSPEQIGENLTLIHNVISSYEAIGEANAIVDYLATVVSLQALATETQASAKFWLLSATNEELDRQAKLAGNDKIAPSIKKLRADAMVRHWHYIYEKATRYSSNISHTIDAVRTKISYLKQEMNNTNH
jgi:hypothetical protein